jgi:hypothetical protein
MVLLRPKGEQSAESDAKDTCLVFPEETGSDGLRIWAFVDIWLYILGIHRITPEIVIPGPNVVVFASTMQWRIGDAAKVTAAPAHRNC